MQRANVYTAIASKLPDRRELSQRIIAILRPYPKLVIPRNIDNKAEPFFKSIQGAGYIIELMADIAGADQRILAVIPRGKLSEPAGVLGVVHVEI
jgi:hypothetical protein